jgi:malonate-semialdehyde dehydrogenase (acetylating)/methylmalonate-semialdehyde dehydrogenase
MSVAPLKNFVNGEFVVSSSGEFLEVSNPSDGKKITSVPLSNTADLNEAVRHANAAFEGWSGLTIKQRAAIMFKFHNLVNVHSQELAELIVKENGKNISEGLVVTLMNDTNASSWGMIDSYTCTNTLFLVCMLV